MFTWLFSLFRRRPAPAQPAPPPLQRPLQLPPQARAPQRSRGRLTGAQLREYQQLRHTARDRAAAAPPAPAPADPGAAALDPYLLLIASYAASDSDPERRDSAPADSWSGGGGESGGAGASGGWDAPSDSSDNSCSSPDSSSDSSCSTSD